LLIAVYSFPKISQDHAYNHFADRRYIWGIPNCANVLSNIPFVLVGALGLWFLHRHWKEKSYFFGRVERLLWLVFFSAVTLIGFGSAYYHWDPTNTTLFWDRLPMSAAFMSLLGIMIADRVSRKAACLLGPLLVLIGIGSVLYWHITELHGQGDLRPYFLVQFFPVAVIPLLCLLFPKPKSYFLYIAIGWYVVAKLCEIYDHQILFMTEWAASGHPLKHLAAALGAFFVFLYLKTRSRI